MRTAQVAVLLAVCGLFGTALVLEVRAFWRELGSR
jgi:hypothetical protein